MLVQSALYFFQSFRSLSLPWTEQKKKKKKKLNLHHKNMAIYMLSENNRNVYIIQTRLIGYIIEEYN